MVNRCLCRPHVGKLLAHKVYLLLSEFLMRRSVLLVAAFALFWGGGAPVMAANLLINGSYENTGGTFVGDGNNTMSLPPGSGAIPGWTTFSNSVAWIGPTNPFGVVASNGSFSLD